VIKPLCPLSVYLLIFMACIATFACTNKRMQVLRGTVVALNAAREGFTAWDNHHQTQIVDRSISRKDAQDKIDIYLDKRELIIKSFAVAYQAVAVAATQVDDLSLTAALAASQGLFDALHALMGETP